MNEFEIINHYFKPLSYKDNNIIESIGDDAAILDIPKGYQLLISTDTSVSGIHFLNSYNPFDIAYKALMVNISDIIAMGAIPKWVTLSLTLIDNDTTWLEEFSKGLKQGLDDYSLSLIGGDTTRGSSVSVTFTLLGIVSCGNAIKRNGAKSDDLIMVSGNLGGASFALNKNIKITTEDKKILMDKQLHPILNPKLGEALQNRANSAIDISDGLAQDLGHILNASNLGATLLLDEIPIHPLVTKYAEKHALDLALFGGDDYELCFTVPSIEIANYFVKNFNAKKIGFIEQKPGLRGIDKQGKLINIQTKGYNHFGVQ